MIGVRPRIIERQQIHYYHNDVSGLPEELTNTEGQVVWSASYKVWGNAVQEHWEAELRQPQNLRFQGQYLDRETGLHYNLFRYYDPDIGRFTQTDPIGLAGGVNLYRYAPNPVTWIDPWGWCFKRAPNQKVSTLKTTERGSKEWKEAVKAIQNNKKNRHKS